jgi:hypothetical protein
MNIKTEICSMKSQQHQNTSALSGIFILVSGCLITSSLLLLNYHSILQLDLEVILAPFVVVTLLTYGDKFLMLLFLSPINFALKLICKVKDSSQSQQQMTLNHS